MTALLKIAHFFRRIYWFLFRPITLGVRILLVEDGRVLLIQHTYQRGWYLPGGGMKRDETLEDAARREAQEEVGAVLRQVEFRGIYTNSSGKKTDHIALFYSDDFSREGEGDAEIARIQFFDPNHLPEDMSSGGRRKIEAFFAGNLDVHGRW